MKLSELAQRCGYEFYGQDMDVLSIRFSDCADTKSIAIIKNNKEIEQTAARCLLVKPTMLRTDKSLLFTSDSIDLASVKVANILYENEMEQNKHMISYKKVNEYYIGKNVEIGRQTYISPNVYIGNNVIIGEECVIEPNVKIGSNVIIGNKVYIAAGSCVGANSFCHYLEDGLKEFPGIGSTIISDEVHIGNNVTIQRGTFSDTYIGTACKIGNLIDIGHDVRIGNNCKIVSQTGIAGNVNIGEYVHIFGQVGISNNVTIGDYVTVYAKSLVTKDVLEYQRISGIYAREHIEELRIQAKIRKL